MDNPRKKERMKELVLELLSIPDEEREDAILEELDTLSPDPAYTNYIFHSNEFINTDGEFMIDEYLEKVFSYKPIAL